MRARKARVDVPARPAVPRRAWKALLVGGAGFSLISFNTTSTNLAFPQIAESFPDVSLSTVSWVASSFFIGLASLLLVSGRLADRVGRRAVFRAGLAVFVLGAALSAVAPNVWALIVARFVASVGGALVIPSSLAVVLPEFPRERHFTAITLWSATGPVASAIAPGVSAVVLALSGWRLLFLLSAPIALGAVAGGWGVLAESKAERRAGALDGVGVLVGTVAIAGLVFAASQGSELGWASRPLLVAYAVVLVSVPVFLRRCRRHAEPLLNLDVFMLRPIWTANLANFFLNLGAMGSWLAWPLFFDRVWRFSTLATGLALIPAPLLSGFVAAYASRLSERVGADRMVRAGSLVPIAANLLAVALLTGEPSYWLVAAPAIALMGGGWALTQPPLNSAVMAQVGADLYGQANAAFNTVRNIAGAMGIAIAVAVIGDPGRADALDAYRRAFLAFTLAAVGCWLVLMVLYPRAARKLAAG